MFEHERDMLFGRLQRLMFVRILLVTAIFGLILVLVIMFEPAGIHGRWLKLKRWCREFPLHKRAAFRRQKTYAKTDRLR